MGSPAPSGMVAFLFTDIEGSTRLWERDPEAMGLSLARHDEIVRTVVEQHGGYVFATGGDGFAVAFGRVGDAMAAAVEAQSALGAVEWGAAAIRSRMGLHCGEAEERGGDYFGTAVNRAARVMAAGHGGQVIATQAFAEVAGSEQLVDLGEHRLRDLSAPQRIYQVGEGEYPPLRSLDAYPTNLPEALSSFIGRGEEVRSIAADVVDHRLVTLSGTGGVGKTRLAAQVCADVLPHFPQGAWFVELAPLRTGAQIPLAIAAACQIPQRPGEALEVTLKDAFATRSMIVVLDNCEHLVDAVADLVAELTGPTMPARMVITSREALGVAGEQVRRVVPMAVGDAAQLFVSRAQALRDDVNWADHADALVQICERLDGIPLAIELAAARSRSMMPADILARLDERFRLLSGGRRGGRERHQTLRAAVEWSHDLLDDHEKTVFARLAVFRGSFDLAAAEAVVAGDGIDALDVVDLVERLVDKSMVATVPSAGTGRFRQLETLRQFAQDRLVESGQVDALRERHEAYYRSFVEEWDPRLMTGDQAEVLERLGLELDNLEAIFERMLEDDRITAMARLHLTLNNYWGVSGSNAGRFWTEQILDRSDEIDDPWLRLEFVAWAVFALYSSGAWRRAGEVRSELQHVVGEDLKALGVGVLFSTALLALEDQRHDELFRAADWALQAADDPYWQMLASVAQLSAVLMTDPVAGLPAAQEFHDAVVAFGIPTLNASALDQLGTGFWRNDRRAEAADAFRRAIDAAGDVIPHVAVNSSIALGVLSAENREPDALPLLSQGVALYRDHPVQPGSIVSALLTAAFVLDEAGRTAEAATCVGAATALQESLGVKGQLILQKQVGVVVARIAAARVDPEIAAAELRGRAMSQDEFCRFVLDLDPIA